LLDEVRGHETPLVLVTGGEPLQQPEVHDLLAALADAGLEVVLETSGTRDIAAVDERVRRIVDVKCPSSGVADDNRWDNVAHLRATDEVKLVVAERRDFDWGLARVREHALDACCGAVLWSAANPGCAPADLAAWLLETRAPGRLQVQLHRVLWPGAARGV